MKDRFFSTRLAVTAALIAGIAFSHELWIGITRTFPRAPFLFALPDGAAVIIEALLTAAVILPLIATIAMRTNEKLVKLATITALAALAVLVLFDQMRLQPWVYLYALILLAILLQQNMKPRDVKKADAKKLDSQGWLILVQLLLGALYFWSGVQKLNFTFAHETLPLLLTPLADTMPWAAAPPAWLGYLIGLTEAVIGIALLIPKSRNIAVILASLMHAMILATLVAKDHNQIVWIWNIALPVLLVICFWKSDTAPLRTFLHDKATLARSAKMIVLAAIVLPVLSFVGLWDLYLSGALYSGNAPIGVIHVGERTEQELPARAKQALVATEGGGKLLEIGNWSLIELNVPYYPETRVFKQIARELCNRSHTKELELIIRTKPHITTGATNIERFRCEELAR